MTYVIRTRLHNGAELTATCSLTELDATMRQIERYMQPSAISPSPGPSVEQVPEMPEKLLAYAMGWSEPWAQHEAIERAKTLWFEYKNWDLVYAELLRQDGEKD